MPITQERFISIIDDAMVFYNINGQVSQLIKDSAQLIQDLNSTIDHTDDPILKGNLAQAIGLLISVRDTLYQDIHGQARAAARIMAEHKHFLSSAKRNARAKVVQERRRKKLSGGEQRPKYDLADYEKEMNSKHKGPKAQPTQPDLIDSFGNKWKPPSDEGITVEHGEGNAEAEVLPQSEDLL
jgi:hypothetical protein